MKAKGINITLTELKKQMEEEENMTSSPIEQASNGSAQAFESNPTQSENTWTTTYSNNSQLNHLTNNQLSHLMNNQFNLLTNNPFNLLIANKHMDSRLME